MFINTQIRLGLVGVALLMLGSYTYAQCRGGSCSRGGSGCSSGSGCGGGEQYVPFPQGAFRNMLNIDLFGNGGGCVGGNCPRSAQNLTAVEWKSVPGYPDQRAKYVGNSQVGSYDLARGIYQSYNAQTQEWGKPEYRLPDDLPEDLKAEFQKKGDAQPSVGSLPSWMTNGVTKPNSFDGNTYIIDGKRVPEGVFTGADTNGVCPDTRGRFNLTVFIRDKVKRDQVSQELSRSPLTDKVNVKVLAPDSWEAKSHKLNESKRFAETGECVFFQGPRGKDGLSQAIWADYTYDGPEAIGKKIDKDFHPDDVPTSNGSGGSPILPVAAIGVICFALFMPSKKNEEEE